MLPDMATRRRKAKPDEVRALAHPLRLRIIRLLYDGPRSNKELAAKVGEDPATVLYHVRTLLKTGFVSPAGTRPGARAASRSSTSRRVSRGTSTSMPDCRTRR